MNTNLLNQEDIKNLLVLIARANITGNEATATAILQQKLNGMVVVSEVTGTEDKKDESSNNQVGEESKAVVQDN